MSRPDEGHRSFFPVGNPFRVILPGGPHLPWKLQALLTNYEGTLALSLRKLKPKDALEVLTLSWMRLAVDCLSELHTNIGTLITELKLPVSDWDEKWVDIYLNSSVKLLDICIALSSELARLDQGQLLVRYVLHVLDSGGGVPSREQLKRAEVSLKEWMDKVGSACPTINSCSTTLQELAGSLCLMKVKNSAKGKVLMRALYGIEAVTVFICSVFVSALSSSPNPLVDLRIPQKFGWSQAFNDLHGTICGELRRQLSGRSFTAVKELEEVEACAKKLHVLTRTGQLEEENDNLVCAVSHSEEARTSDSTAPNGDHEGNLKLADDTSQECEVIMSESIAEGTQEAEMMMPKSITEEGVQDVVMQDTKAISYGDEVTKLESISQDRNIDQANGINIENSTGVPERTIMPEDKEELLYCISSMSKSAEGLRLGLDSLSKRVGDFFQIVLTGRDALLCNLRMSDAASKVAEVRS
ncbi:UPF0496 protein 4 [Brachypodium distachyon]|uniref:Uncharacterized protein n=1 Tax=Brachypodium distachyon TaxID=15368 RepID=I1I5A6_BRADI|nr:UPF0496 protein 4 [Brachypodium distachyon]KQJ97399.1 hypothetical protein BRADI_3g30530v3 [Brachypodium distachyon]|eukprot:XP_003574179.1 UPF0496 protein 4 [Brachypodium distachyon]